MGELLKSSFCTLLLVSSFSRKRHEICFRCSFGRFGCCSSRSRNDTVRSTSGSPDCNGKQPPIGRIWSTESTFSWHNSESRYATMDEKILVRNLEQDEQRTVALAFVALDKALKNLIPAFPALAKSLQSVTEGLIHLSEPLSRYTESFSVNGETQYPGVSKEM